MKKTLFLMAALAICACGRKAAQETPMAEEETPVADTLVYAGVLPAADCDGIAYELKLVADEARSCVVTSTYLGVEEGETETFVEQGTYQVIELGGEKYYKVNCGGQQQNFAAIDDETLRMLSFDHHDHDHDDCDHEEEHEEDMNYDLKLKK